MPDLDFETILTGATFVMSMKEWQARKQAAEDQKQQSETQSFDGGGENLPVDYEQRKRIAQSQETTTDKLDQILENDEIRNPSSADKDAYTSVTLDLSDGETAVVTVQPEQGWNLRVQEVHMDRKTDHDYEINVGGEVNSVSHRAKYAKPKLVTQSGTVVATVTNNSGSSSVIDYELVAWAERGR